MKFFDMHVHSIFAGGESSLEEIAETLKSLGYSGFCFVCYFEDETQLEILKAEVERVGKEKGIEIFLGFEARNKRELRQLIKLRRKYDVLLVRGGNLSLNRVACETPEVDILTHPELGRNDSGIDHVSARFASENDVAIELNFKELLITSGKKRSKILRYMARNVELCRKYGTKIIINSGAVSKWDLRHPLSLISLGVIAGLDLKVAKECISQVPASIIKKIRERQKEEWIMPGVRVLKW